VRHNGSPQLADLEHLSREVGEEFVRVGLLTTAEARSLTVTPGTEFLPWRLSLQGGTAQAPRRVPGLDSQGALGWSATAAFGRLEAIRALLADLPDRG
jgi:hypothetical protein